MVILAGDIDRGRNGLDWIRHWFPDRPVLYVLGNHEYYRHALPALTLELMQETAGTNIHLLENQAVELFGYAFLGCTLWTDFLAGGNALTAMQEANSLINDFRLIRNSNEHRRLRAQDIARVNEDSVAWLRRELAKHDPQRTVVVTHHAPSLRSGEPRYQGSALTAAFLSKLDALVETSGVPLWVHGHTHYNVNYHLGSTRVLSNQRGYPSQLCKGFNTAMVLEV